jgi:hypothetical protein
MTAERGVNASILVGAGDRDGGRIRRRARTPDQLVWVRMKLTARSHDSFAASAL